MNENAPMDAESILRPGMGFDEWREALWENVKRGQGFRNNPGFLYRAVSDQEFDAARRTGVFKDLSKQGLYVTNDPDRLAGGAYGGRSGGYIIQFQKPDQMMRRPSQNVRGLEEDAVGEIPMTSVVRLFKWDPVRRDHVLVK